MIQTPKLVRIGLSAVAVGLICVFGCAGPRGTGARDDPMYGIPRGDSAGNERVKVEDIAEPPPENASTPAALTSGATIGTPKPAETPTAQTPAATVGFEATTGNETYEQLQQLLQTRGVVWQSLSVRGKGKEWLFQCGVPTPGQAGVERYYEGRAAGTSGLEAIRAVLADIDADQQR